jgi:hypothetical protein
MGHGLNDTPVLHRLLRAGTCLSTSFLTTCIPIFKSPSESVHCVHYSSYYVDPKSNMTSQCGLCQML